MKRFFLPMSIVSLCLLLSGCSLSQNEPSSEPQPTVSQAIMVPESTSSLQAAPDDTIEMEVIPYMDYQDTDFVRVLDYIPDLVMDLKYAQSDNFTGQTIYEFQDSYLRFGTVKKLMAVQDELRSLGYGLKLWDGFRPVSAQFRLWEILPDDTYVANPNIGFSSHSRGNTVDVTIVGSNGLELEMPTGFDDFSTRADRDYSECPEPAASNARLLEDIMHRNGFKGYYGEWWHFADTVKYEVEKCFDPSVISHAKVIPEGDYASLHIAADLESEIVAFVEHGTIVTLLGYDDEFVLVDYDNQRGYLLASALTRY